MKTTWALIILGLTVCRAAAAEGGASQEYSEQMRRAPFGRLADIPLDGMGTSFYAGFHSDSAVMYFHRQGWCREQDSLNGISNPHESEYLERFSVPYNRHFQADSTYDIDFAALRPDIPDKWLLVSFQLFGTREQAH